MSSFPLRLQPELKAKLDRLAKDDGRSLNSYIERVLEHHAMDRDEKDEITQVLRAAKILKKAKRK